jgi:putative transposase
VPLEKSSSHVGEVRAVHWDHVGVIVSLLYKVARKLLSVPSVLLRGQATKDAELLVLRHENAVLRRQLAGPAAETGAGRRVRPPTAPYSSGQGNVDPGKESVRFS